MTPETLANRDHFSLMRGGNSAASAPLIQINASGRENDSTIPGKGRRI
jgi:hypothetical protein